MKTFTLYGLRKPGEEARYIGITSQTLKRRHGQHNRAGENPYKDNWIAKMWREENLYPEIIPYCVGLTEKEACELEVSVIAELRKWKHPLINFCVGGNLPPVLFGNKNALGYKKSPALVEKMAAWHRGRKRSQETKDKMSASLIGNSRALGIKRSLETKKKMSEAALLREEKKRQEVYL